MKIVRTVAELRTAVAAARARGARIGLVPTMGALHEGHVSLIRRAREECGFVIVTLFVNPAQFNDPRDLERYPRDEPLDATTTAKAGAHLLFAPRVSEVYPADFSTTIDVRGVTELWDGAIRGKAHFSGVATVVMKLLQMAQPDVAFFGQKDAQQVMVIKRLVRDLNVPVSIEVCPTIRESDGLAMSSRNALLTPAERTRAVALSRALFAIRDAWKAGQKNSALLLTAGHAELARDDIVAEYLAIVDAESLHAVDVIESDALVLLAARVGSVRLIDNVPLRVTDAS